MRNRKFALFLCIAILSVFSTSISAQKYIELPLWQENVGGNPQIMVYLPENPNGQAIVACPGGGYGFLATEHEGTDFAPWLNEQGIALIVLKYRMPNGVHDIPLSDAKQAMRMVREHADEWQIDSRKIGVMGFSAGGHLASTLATHYDDMSRPDFQILFYPVVTMDKTYTHQGSRSNLLGANPSDELVRLYSNELQVNRQTPPAFILFSDDDTTVPSPNGVNYYLALKKNNVSSEMHIYPTGGHGWGFNDSFIYKSQWIASLKKWLEITNKNVAIRLSEFDYTDKKESLTSSLPQEIDLSALIDNDIKTGITVDYSPNTSFRIKLNTSVAVTGYSLSVKSSDTKNNPLSWKLEGSVSGNVWHTLNTQKNQTFISTDTKIIDIPSSASAYNHFRLTIESNNGGDKLHLAEWQLFGYSKSTYKESLTSKEGVTTGQYSGVNQGGFVETIDKLTDGDFNTKYCVLGYAGGWMQYELPSAATVDRYSITSAEKIIADRDPKEWQLLGSNDGNKWDVLDTRRNQDFIATHSTLEYPVSDPRPYKIYKLNVLDNKSENGNDFQLTEWMLFEQDASSISFAQSNSSISTSKGMIHIKTESGTDYEIFNLQGAKIAEGAIIKGDEDIEILNSGVYFVKINTQQGVVTEKIIVQH